MWCEMQAARYERQRDSRHRVMDTGAPAADTQLQLRRQLAAIRRHSVPC